MHAKRYCYAPGIDAAYGSLVLLVMMLRLLVLLLALLVFVIHAVRI